VCPENSLWRGSSEEDLEILRREKQLCIAYLEQISVHKMLL
jgi:hypothetical protein